MEDLGEGRGSYTCSDPKLSGAGLGEDPWRPGEWSALVSGAESARDQREWEDSMIGHEVREVAVTRL